MNFPHRSESSSGSSGRSNPRAMTAAHPRVFSHGAPGLQTPATKHSDGDGRKAGKKHGKCKTKLRFWWIGLRSKMPTERPAGSPLSVAQSEKEHARRSN